jgi:hypothetical protein
MVSVATVSCSTRCEYVASWCFSRVLTRARCDVHCARNFIDQIHSRGSADGRKRSAWSLRTSDFSRIHGAFGEDQTKE